MSVPSRRNSPGVVQMARMKVILVHRKQAGKRRTMARGPLKKRLFVTVDCAETA